MKRRLFLNVVIAESASILELFAGEDESLLIGGDALLVLDFRLDIVDGVGGFDIEGDGLAREGFDKYLHDWNTRLPTLYSSINSLFEEIQSV